MENTVEKSCWGITMWAVVVVVGLAIVTSFVLKSGDTVVSGEKPSSAVATASSVSG